MRIHTLVLSAALALTFAVAWQTTPSIAQSIDQARADAAIKAAFPTAPPDWAPRLVQDETMKVCSATHNNPPKDANDAILKRERASIEYPADGKFMGDWKKGEALAQSGFGLRFTDYPPGSRVNGGNCYACHQITKAEVSYGTVGPSLLGYGKLREFKEAEVKAAYEKIYNAQAVLACSLMPRFGSNKILTTDQIKDIVALLMSPESPANQ